MRARGFTFIELLLVLTIVALLASLVAPSVTKSVHRAKEAALKENLYVMRKAIDDYYADSGVYPAELAVLVEKRYLRQIPEDPLTERADGWQVLRDEDERGVNGIIDVRSGSDETDPRGRPYRDW